MLRKLCFSNFGGPTTIANMEIIGRPQCVGILELGLKKMSELKRRMYPCAKVPPQAPEKFLLCAQVLL